MELNELWTTEETAFLRDTDKLNKFKIALRNRLQNLLEEEAVMENNWKGNQRSTNSNVSRGSGHKKHHHKE
ncbi:unnamed protein product [Schistosoma margrebowiei]|uniref:Uncharacterized protein n=1 Tax=Schistosoma margrebowiei TaxID=48269 RepID=A0A183MXY7_9TREM|nr:unnamed protein product [Schistosoma margrebowiei]